MVATKTGQIIIPPSKKRGYIGVTVSGSLSVGRPAGSHILSGLFLTNHWVEFNKVLHEASIPRGYQGVTIACYFTELWAFYLLSYGVGQGAV